MSQKPVGRTLVQLHRLGGPLPLHTHIKQYSVNQRASYTKCIQLILRAASKETLQKTMRWHSCSGFLFTCNSRALINPLTSWWMLSMALLYLSQSLCILSKLWDKWDVRSVPTICKSCTFFFQFHSENVKYRADAAFAETLQQSSLDIWRDFRQ